MPPPGRSDPPNPRRRPRAAASFVLAAIAWASPHGALAQETAPLEYQVKAAFLFNFAKFTEWPDGTFREGETDFLVCVVENEPFARAFDLVVSGKTVEGRVFKIRRLQAVDDTPGCRILFIGAAEPPRVAALIRAARAGSTLTVGDAPNFARRGGIINFVIKDNRVHFEINPDAARRAGLRISSKLLQLATIVEDTTPAQDER